MWAVILVSYAASQGEETFVSGESITRKHIELVIIAHDHIQDRAASGGQGGASRGRYISNSLHACHTIQCFSDKWINCNPYVLCSRTEPVVIPQRWVQRLIIKYRIGHQSLSIYLHTFIQDGAGWGASSGGGGGTTGKHARLPSHMGVFFGQPLSCNPCISYMCICSNTGRVHHCGRFGIAFHSPPTCIPSHTVQYLLDNCQL